jgi:transcriptional regulator with XRE-family HTH domain
VKDQALVALGRNINRLRVSASLTQEELAERTDLSRRFIQELEAGEKGPALATLGRLRKALSAAWDDLLRGI